MTFTLKQLQTEQAEWAERNFPGHESWQPLMGLCEEMGEFYEAWTNEKQGDAIADMAIFLVHYCTKSEWAIGDVMAIKYDDPGMPTPAIVGKLCHHHLKKTQGIRGTSDEHDRWGQKYACALMLRLTRNCGGEERFLELLDRVWSNVKQRDWRPKQ